MKKLLLIALLPLSVNAGNYYDSDDCCAEVNQTVDQNIYITAPAGRDGTDGINGLSYNSERIDSMAAQFSAIANLPGLNHRSGDHNHTGVAVGVGAAGDELAGAVGLIHHYEKNIVVKVSGAFSKEYRNSYGVGASFAW